MMLGATGPFAELGSRIRVPGESSSVADGGNNRTRYEPADAESAEVRVWIDEMICEPMSEPEKDEGQLAARFVIDDHGVLGSSNSRHKFVMDALPSRPDIGSNATHEPAAVLDMARDVVWTDVSEMAIPKSKPTGANLQLWRKVSFAVYACNRMRLVLESLRPVDEQTAKQTIDYLFSLPPFDEALQVQLRNCSSFRSATTEERQSQCIGTSFMPAFAHNYFRTHSGKLVVILESLQPVEKGSEYQIASQLIDCATRSIRFVGGSEFPDLPMPGTILPENAGGIDRTEVLMGEELMYEPVPVAEEDGSVEFGLRNVDPNLQEHYRNPDSEQQIQLRKYQDVSDRTGDQVGDTMRVVMEEEGDNGIMQNHSLIYLPDKSTSDSPRERLVDLDPLPIFPVQDHSTARRACAPPQAGGRPIGPECAGSVFLTHPWMKKFDEGKSPYHSEFQKLISKTYEFESFKREVNQLNGNLSQRFDEIDRTVANFSKSEKNIQKRLPKAISRIIDICHGDLGQLVLKTERISGNLDKIEKQHELSVNLRLPSAPPQNPQNGECSPPPKRRRRLRSNMNSH